MLEALLGFILGIFQTDAKIRDESLTGESEFEAKGRKTVAVVLVIISGVFTAVWLYLKA